MTELVELRRDPIAVRRILEALPDWFGDPDAIDNYVEAVVNPAFESYTVTADDATVAIALVRRHFPESAELHLIAVDPGSRGRGEALSTMSRQSWLVTDAVTSACTRSQRRSTTRHTRRPARSTSAPDSSLSKSTRTSTGRDQA
jgi:predicted RNA-binding Zn ribbon-like protein